jgi:hypothetical protein
MKKLFLAVCACVLSVSLFSCIDIKDADAVEIPDSNFKSYLLANFDKDKDGDITIGEAKKVKEINVSNRGIEKLDGIEKFVNLVSLDCSNNQLEELELRYNKKLKKLICTENRTPLTIYIGMTSPLKKSDVSVPKKGETPDVNSMRNPLDPNKATFDADKTNVFLSFED